MSCDPIYDTEWKVDNQSTFMIEVMSINNTSQDTVLNSLPLNNSQTIFTDFNVGDGDSFKESATSASSSISYLNITNNNGDEVNKDLISLENWTCEHQSSEFFTFTLVITDDDFE